MYSFLRSKKSFGVFPVLALVAVITLDCKSGEKEEGRPDAGSAGVTWPRASDPDMQKHLNNLKGKVPAGFVVLIEPPFVVVGDESPELVNRRAEGTVRWAVSMLKKDFFAQDPEHILDIWLFKDEESYMSHTKAIFDDVPDTPYGYYTPTHKALIMNIQTGGGTLVHEIVHPFMASNFPACPTWFNEGMGSLYEQCGERDGKIVGFTNWRLAGLQRAISEGYLPTFEHLTKTSEAEFYDGELSGLYYAQARYLCYYLQQKGLLRTYYREFLAHHEEDPTGYQTLIGVLGESDMVDFQKRWEAFVMALVF